MKKWALLLLFLSGSVLADDIITIQSTITGSQEQPKVISIVPWQKPEDPDYFGKDAALKGKLPKDFKLLDRKSFAVELKYISVMRKSTGK